MRIDELKKIAEENKYRLCDDSSWLYLIKRRVDEADFIIAINLLYSNSLSISNFSGSDEDLEVLKAAIKFCEIPVPDRGFRGFE